MKEKEIVRRDTMIGYRIIASLMFVALGITPAAVAQSGPQSGGTETVARPRSQGEEPRQADPDEELPPIPSEYNRRDLPVVPEDAPVFRADVTTVTVDVAVVDNQGRFIPEVPQGYFRVLEDKVPQKITGFTVGDEAPMTVCMLIEFSAQYQQYWSETWHQTLTAAHGFLDTLKSEDYVAAVAFDMRTTILTDFTTDKRQARAALSTLQMPGFRESNLFDALVDMAERMSSIEGRKAIVVIASGMDTFSKLNFGETRRRLQVAGVPIYSIGLMQALRDYYDSRGYLGPIARMDFLQADNQLRTFSNETGGAAFFPKFYGEFPSIFAAIADGLRNQYTLTYNPTNQAKDGEFRKIQVELVDPESGENLRIMDQRNRPVRYRIIAKDGYRAPREVE